VTLDHDTTLDQLIEQVSARRSDAVSTLELLEGYTQEIEANVPALENPQAIRDYLSFFTTMIGAAVADCQRIAAELTTEGGREEQVTTLRRLTEESAAEQRRCLTFRDKWINKPLPQERMRPLLNNISVTTRDQLTAFRDLGNIATRLEDLIRATTPPQEPEKRRYDRRALFRLFKP